MRRAYLAGVIIVIIGLAVGGYFVFHKSPKATANTTYNTTSNTSQSTTPPASSSVVETKTSSSLGKYLADPTGRPLYTYGKDTTGVSNCTGSCLSAWPPYTAVNPPASLPTNVTVIKRTDNGESQYAYKGMPLYYFTADSNDQPSGNGVNNFSLARP